VLESKRTLLERFRPSDFDPKILLSRRLAHARKESGNRVTRRRKVTIDLTAREFAGSRSDRRILTRIKVFPFFLFSRRRDSNRPIILVACDTQQVCVRGAGRV